MKNDLIKKYLANKLTPEERNAFEQEMENDPFLLESIEGLSLQNKELSMEQLNVLETELHNNIDIKTRQARKGKVISFSFFKYAAAACIIVMVAIAGWRFSFLQKNINTDELYSMYYKPLTHPDATVRGENDSTKELHAIQAYEKEDYFEAVNFYQKLVENNPGNVKNNLFLGISYLSTNQAKKAIGTFTQIAASEEFHSDIQWYLALAYIKNKELSQAESILNILSKEENYYQKNAQEILGKIDGKIASKE